MAAYRSLDSSIQPGIIPHECCSFCAKTCQCNQEGCSGDTLLFQESEVEGKEQPKKRRDITPIDRSYLKNALIEVFQYLRGGGIFGESTMEWFSMKLVDDVDESCAEIFTIDDLTSKVPVFSIANALRVLEVIQEVFLDIPYFEETMLHFASQGICLDMPPITWMDMDDSALYECNSDNDDLLENL